MCAGAQAFGSLLVILLAAAFSQAEFQVNTWTQGYQYAPSVAMNDAGDAVIVWRSDGQTTGKWDVYGQRYDSAGNPVGGEFKVNVNPCFALTGWWPSAAMSPSGSFVVTWSNRDWSTQDDIAARLFGPDGTPLTDEFIVSAEVYGDPNLMEGYTAQGESSIAMNARGDFVITYQSWHGGREGGYCATGRAYTAAGVPRGEEFVIDDQHFSHHVVAAMEDSGDFVAAWVRQGGLNDLPYGEYLRLRRYYADGTPKGGIVEITGDLSIGPNDARTSIAIDSTGNFIIAWARGPHPYDVYAQRFDPNGSPLGAQFMVNDPTDNAQVHPSVAIGPLGGSVIVWAGKSADGEFDVFGRQYDAHGTPVGDVFQFNTYTAGRQWSPDCAWNASGRLFTAWESWQQDGTPRSVYGDIRIIPEVPPSNEPPGVDAGSDKTAMLPNLVALSCTATDDGLPDPPAACTTTWSKVSGPGAVTFANSNAPSTMASFSEAGTYVLRLTADDSELSTTDDVTVTVKAAGDFNGDGKVNGQDFLIWQQHYPTASGASPEIGDANGDGKVNGQDFLIWQAQYRP